MCLSVTTMGSACGVVCSAQRAERPATLGPVLNAQPPWGQSLMRMGGSTPEATGITIASLYSRPD